MILIKCFPLYIKYKFRIISKNKFKNDFLTRFLKNFSKDVLDKNAENFVSFYFSHLKNNDLDFINKLKVDKKNEISIVTASLDLWINPIAKKIGVKYISTKSNFKNNTFIGIDGENCNGKQKVLRIKEVYKIENYNDIYAYGDSDGDFDMLSIADHKNFRLF